MQRLLRQNSEEVNSEYGTSLGEEHELGELPAYDEQRRGRGHRDQVDPARAPGPRGHRDGEDLREAEREGEALPERGRPHDPGGLAVVVEEAEDRQEAARH